jgi:transcriptional regulator with XRE-family HTH domain
MMSSMPIDARGIKQERARRGWSQTRLSALTGIAAADISAVERGRKYPHPGWRRRIAAAFGMAESELFSAPRRR